MSLLVVAVAGRLVGLPLERIAHILRPLEVRPLPGLPPFVVGAAVVRGVVTPVVDLPRLLGHTAPRPSRWVVVHEGRPGQTRRTVALAVDEVLGVRPAPPAADLPPLLAGTTAVPALAAVGGELQTLLDAARLVSDEAVEAARDGAGG